MIKTKLFLISTLCLFSGNLLAADTAKCDWDEEKTTADYTTTSSSSNDRVISGCGKKDGICGNHTSYDNDDATMQFGVEMGLDPWETRRMTIRCSSFDRRSTRVEGHCSNSSVSCEEDITYHADVKTYDGYDESRFIDCTNWGTERLHFTVDTIHCNGDDNNIIRLDDCA